MHGVTKSCYAGLVAFLLGSAEAAANEVTDWNRKAASVVTEGGAVVAAQPSAVLGMVAIAQHDALNAIDRRYYAYVHTDVMPRASPDAAVHGAARGVLLRMFPAQSATIETEYLSRMALIPDSAEKVTGAALGDAAAHAIVAVRQGDPLFAPASTRPTYKWLAQGPGVYEPTPPAYSVAQPTLFIAGGRPFTLTSSSQFRPAGTPDLSSDLYATDYNEVKEIGRKGSAVRTADQTHAALFFIEGSTTVIMNRIGLPAIETKNLDLWDSARALALLNMSLADAAISAFEAKFHFNTWRPVTAIRKGETDGNANTEADPNWEPEIPTPNHPEYAAGHPFGCSAGGHTLEVVLDDAAYAFATTSASHGTPRSYATLDAFAQECGNARVWAGVHFSNSIRASYVAGREVSNWVIRNTLRKAH